MARIMVSMSGLDLSFMKDWEPPIKQALAKAKRRAGKSKRSDIVSVPYLMGDIKPFVSPIDGTEITSRSTLRAHEHTHQVRQAGDFKPGEIIAKENKRIAHSLEQGKGAVSKWG